MANQHLRLAALIRYPAGMMSSPKEKTESTDTRKERVRGPASVSRTTVQDETTDISHN